MGKPRYFVGLKLLIKQRKYTLDLVQETDILGCKSASTPMKVNVDLWCDNSHLLDALDNIGD